MTLAHRTGSILLATLMALLLCNATPSHAESPDALFINMNTDVILSSDHVIDLGPGGGENGGRIVSAGTPEEIIADSASVTGAFLVQERAIRNGG